MIIECKKCFWKGSPAVSMSGNHIKITCPDCGIYIKFAKFSDLDVTDLANLKKWQEKKTKCDYTHDDKYVMLDEFDLAFRVFNYCPGCGIKLKEEG